MSAHPRAGPEIAVVDIVRLNWFLGVFAIEVWLAAWVIAYEGVIRRWFKRRLYRARMRRLQAAARRPPQARPA